MKLLFDENLSSRLVHTLAGIYPDSEHVQYSKLDTADDSRIWDYAKANGFTLVSKDSDFYDRRVVLGSPRNTSGSTTRRSVPGTRSA